MTPGEEPTMFRSPRHAALAIAFDALLIVGIPATCPAQAVAVYLVPVPAAVSVQAPSALLAPVAVNPSGHYLILVQSPTAAAPSSSAPAALDPRVTRVAFSQPPLATPR